MERNQNGTIKQGVVLNPNGRPKGKSNKTTTEMKELIKSFVERELDEVNDLLKQLTAKERLDVLCKLIPYVIPKQTEILSDGFNPINIINLGRGIKPTDDNS